MACWLHVHEMLEYSFLEAECKYFEPVCPRSRRSSGVEKPTTVFSGFDH